MSLYLLKVKHISKYNNPSTEEYVQLTKEGLNGVAIMIKSMLFDENYKINFTITDDQYNVLDVDEIIKNSDNILLSEEPAFDISPVKDKEWTETIIDEGLLYNQKVVITKSFTIKIDAEYYYVCHFDTPDFIQGLFLVLRLLDQSAGDYLRYLHQGNTLISM